MSKQDSDEMKVRPPPKGSKPPHPAPTPSVDLFPHDRTKVPKRSQAPLIIGIATLVLGLIVICSIGVTGFVILQPETVQPVKAVAPTAAPQLFEIEGEGDDVFFYNAPSTGLYVMGFTHVGERNFFVKITGADGVPQLLVTATGGYSGKKTTSLEQGEYLVEVTADGPWISVIAAPGVK